LFLSVSELLVAKRRTAFAQFAEACFGAGLVVLSLFAYCTRDWRHLQLSLSIPAAASIIIWWQVYFLDLRHVICFAQLQVCCHM